MSRAASLSAAHSAKFLKQRLRNAAEDGLVRWRRGRSSAARASESHLRRCQIVSLLCACNLETRGDGMQEEDERKRE